MSLSAAEDESGFLATLKHLICSLCKFSIKFSTELSVEGTLGIRVDGNNVLLLHITENYASVDWSDDQSKAAAKELILAGYPQPSPHSIDPFLQVQGLAGLSLSGMPSSSEERTASPHRPGWSQTMKGQVSAGGSPIRHESHGHKQMRRVSPYMIEPWAPSKDPARGTPGETSYTAASESVAENLPHDTAKGAYGPGIASVFSPILPFSQVSSGNQHSKKRKIPRKQESSEIIRRLTDPLQTQMPSRQDISGADSQSATNVLYQPRLPDESVKPEPCDEGYGSGVRISANSTLVVDNKMSGSNSAPTLGSNSAPTLTAVLGSYSTAPAVVQTVSDHSQQPTPSYRVLRDALSSQPGAIHPSRSDAAVLTASTEEAIAPRRRCMSEGRSLLSTLLTQGHGDPGTGREPLHNILSRTKGDAAQSPATHSHKDTSLRATSSPAPNQGSGSVQLRNLLLGKDYDRPQSAETVKKEELENANFPKVTFGLHSPEQGNASDKLQMVIDVEDNESPSLEMRASGPCAVDQFSRVPLRSSENKCSVHFGLAEESEGDQSGYSGMESQDQSSPNPQWLESRTSQTPVLSPSGSSSSLLRMKKSSTLSKFQEQIENENQMEQMNQSETTDHQNYYTTVPENNGSSMMQQESSQSTFTIPTMPNPYQVRVESVRSTVNVSNSAAVSEMQNTGIMPSLRQSLLYDYKQAEKPYFLPPQSSRPDTEDFQNPPDSTSQESAECVQNTSIPESSAMCPGDTEDDINIITEEQFSSRGRGHELPLKLRKYQDHQLRPREQSLLHQPQPRTGQSQGVAFGISPMGYNMDLEGDSEGSIGSAGSPASRDAIRLPSVSPIQESPVDNVQAQSSTGATAETIRMQTNVQFTLPTTRLPTSTHSPPLVSSIQPDPNTTTQLSASEQRPLTMRQVFEEFIKKKCTNLEN